MEFPELLKPFYSVEAGASLIDLAEAPVTMKAGKLAVQGHGRAKLRFQPRFILSVAADFPDHAMEAYMALSEREAVELRFGAKFQNVPVHVRQLNLAASEGNASVHADLMPNPQRMTYHEKNQLVARLLVHIINFPLFLGTEEDVRCATPTGGWRYIGREILRDPPWQIELQELPEAKAVVEKLKESASYGITHVAQLTRQDGRGFSVKDAEKVIQHLYLFLSFARGAWTPPILGVGFDSAGHVVHEDWGIRIGTPWELRRGWFDIHHGDALSQLFPGFRSLIERPRIGKAVSNALYWYLRSNRGGEGAGIDSGIILSQAALERLTSAYLEAAAVTMPKKTNAADHLRETLSRMGIPLAIPDVLSRLKDAERTGCWKDGPEALTRVRNELVHPRNKLPIKIGSVIPDTWNLAQWYTELIILNLAGHSGEYANRLTGRWVGEVDTVPWAAANPKRRKAKR